MKKFKKFADSFGKKAQRPSRERNSKGSLMFQSYCSECGEKCQVPFKPTGEKPVFCSICFDQQQGGGSSRRDDHRRDDRGSRGNYNRKETFQDNQGGLTSDELIEELEEEFDLLHSKLDAILAELKNSRSDSKEKGRREFKPRR